MEWKEYLNDRVIAEHPQGFYVIKQKDLPIENMPIFCPVCEAIMTSLYDESAYKKFSCCDGCANKWAYRNQDRWLSGWRPTIEEIHDDNI